MAGKSNVVLCTIGDAATRQGEFFEAITFAIQESLPIVFVIEDNGFGISTSTARQLPFRLDLFTKSLYQKVDGRLVESVHAASCNAIARARHGDGPMILWMELDRLASHTHSDDHRAYRSASEIANLQSRDPVEVYAQLVVSRHEVTDTEVQIMRHEVEVIVDDAYLEAENESGPELVSAEKSVLGPCNPDGYALPFTLGQTGSTMVGALNLCLREALDRLPTTILFGEDIEDPKGGVFGFTKGLSTRHPGRVINSPLAEATIVGTAVGLAVTGYRPIFELQFIDFVIPGLNQLINQVATLRWRSNGDWTCPAVFYAPCGAYLPAGGPWHSQSNEAFWTHIPGLRVVVPSSPEDLAGILWTALHEDDPTLLLVPKHIMRVRHRAAEARAVGFGRGRIIQPGSDVTVVAWGNCVELARQAAEDLISECSVEIVDPISLVPCDWEMIELSIAKTGRLVVISEDARTSSFGQAIVAHVVGSQDQFNRFLSPPLLVARPDEHVAFHPAVEYATLPDLAKVKAAIIDVLG
jgi:2-oxoisovalerate dehydrogenase E1 component